MLENKFAFYQEMTLLPSEEINNNFLMNKIYGELHKIFSEYKKNDKVDMALSFPHYNLKQLSLGDKIRVFFYDEKQIEAVNLKKRFLNYQDYVHITNMRNVPDLSRTYECYSRVQKKINKERLIKRFANRHNISFTEASEKYKNFHEEKIDLPFVRIKSNSNSNLYILYIKKIESEEITGSFNSYGLSKTATVPSF